MSDIIKTITSELPGLVESACFEGANIILYTNNKEFFLSSEEKIRELVGKVKKRIELRASAELLLSKEETEKIIKKEIPEEAEIQDINFDDARSIVVIEARKPGMAIGKGGEILKKIKEKTFWIPQVVRSPIIESKITTAIRNILFSKKEYRKKFLNSVGKKIYKEWSPEKKEEWARISFLGGAAQVGRSCLLLQTPETRILIDCGLDIAASNKEKFPYMNAPEFNLKDIDAIIISHPHLDHSGLLPYLYKIGYKGPCYMTLPTRDITALLALDYIGVSYKKAAHPLFNSSDIKQMVKHCITLNYNEVTDIAPDVRLTLYNAGHTIGSAMIHLNIGNGLHNLLYTGDFKFARTRTLDIASHVFPRVETVITEATYGSKKDVLPRRKEAEALLLETIKKTLERKGHVLIPVLGVGRAQEIMLIVDNAIKQGLIPQTNIYLDGLLWDVTTIHTAYPEFLSRYLRNQIYRGDNPFISDSFKRVGSPQEREEVINGKASIVIATSGMLVGGASVEYFKAFCGNKKDTIAFVSYQAANSLGRKVLEAAKHNLKEIQIENTTLPLKLEIINVEGLTGHSTRNELLNFFNNIEPKPRRVIVNHGEFSKCIDLSLTLRNIFKFDIEVPKNLDAVRLV